MIAADMKRRGWVQTAQFLPFTPRPYVPTDEKQTLGRQAPQPSVQALSTIKENPANRNRPGYLARPRQRLIPFLATLVIHVGFGAMLVFSSTQEPVRQAPAEIVMITTYNVSAPKTPAKQLPPAAHTARGANPLLTPGTTVKPIIAPKLEAVFTAAGADLGSGQSVVVAAPTIAAPAPLQEKVPGLSSSERQKRSTDYALLLMGHLQKFKKYPRALRDSGVEGRGLVRFRLTPDGYIISMTVVKSTGSPALDGIVRDIFERAQPFPIPDWSRDILQTSFTLPVDFSITP